MSIIYFGFSTDLKKNCHVNLPSAISQSDYTFKVISEVTKAEYFYCTNYTKHKTKNDKKFPMRMRLGFFSNFIDSFYALKEIKKRKNVKKIILYHSLIFFFLVLLLRFLKKNVTLQINEIYSNEKLYSSIIKNLMEKIMIYLSFDYILSTKELIKQIPNKKFSTNKIPIISGPLHLKYFNNKNLKNYIRKKNSFLSLVYAGLIDKIKLEGAFMSVELAKFLNDKKFRIYIYGYGNDEIVSELKKNIKNSNKKYSTKVYFKGCLSPLQIIPSIKKYHIGLVLQKQKPFAQTSFPSKALTYLSAGLFPVFSYSKPIQKWVADNNIGYVYKNNNLYDLAIYLKKIDYLDRKEIIMSAQRVHESTKKILSKFLL